MDEIIKELKEIMKKHDLNIAAIARYLDVSTMSVHRWVNKNWVPSSISKRRIRVGIEKIHEAFPETESTWELLQKSKGLWLKVKHKMTPEEKLELLDLQNSNKPLEAYIERLEELVKKYQPDKQQIQMFAPTDDGKK